MFANLGGSSRTEMHVAGMFLHGKSAQIKKNNGKHDVKALFGIRWNVGICWNMLDSTMNDDAFDVFWDYILHGYHGCPH